MATDSGLNSRQGTILKSKSNRKWIFPVFACGLYAVLYLSLIYYPGLVRMDDFGYLQGVIETLAQGRIQTHQWLEPYSASLSALSSIAYLTTGNFPLSTWGFQSLFVFFNVALLYRLFRFRLDSKASSILALVIGSNPVYWHKCSEFGGTVTTVTFVLLSLWAYLSGRWMWFFLTAFLAFSNRQNSIALLALPVYHFYSGQSHKDKTGTKASPGWASRWALVAGVILFIAGALFLHSQMNQTIAQQYGIYAGMNPGKVSAILHTQLFGIFSGLAFLSIFGLLTGENPRQNLRTNFREPKALLILTLGLWLLPIFWSMPLISFLTPLIGSVDRTFFLQKILLVVIPILLWTLDYRHLKLDGPFCLFAAYIFMSGLRGYWYDFYLIDVALAALFFRFTREGTFSMGPWPIVVAGLLFAANVGWGYGYKLLSDKQKLSVSVYENLERTGKTKVEDMTDATFGYLGWKLFDQYWHHERITYLANFMCYGRRDRVVIESELPWRRTFKSGEATGNVVESGLASIGFFQLRYRVLDKHSSSNIPFCESEPLVLDRSSFRIKPFPLNEREWSQYVEEQRQQIRDR